jgi:hypothetical protein
MLKAFKLVLFSFLKIKKLDKNKPVSLNLDLVKFVRELFIYGNLCLGLLGLG